MPWYRHAWEVSALRNALKMFGNECRGHQTRLGLLYVVPSSSKAHSSTDPTSIYNVA